MADHVTKADLRRRYRQRRSAVAVELIEGWSAAIAGRVALLDDWIKAEAVHSFVGALPGEVRTLGLIEQALQQRKRTICPRVRAHGQLEHREIARLSDLRSSAFGLFEPDVDLAPPVDPDCVGVVLVPGVAFAPDGARLGMGGGYYDRFLAQSSALTIGLAFEMQLAQSLPQAVHDHAVDLIVTELQVIRCR